MGSVFFRFGLKKIMKEKNHVVPDEVFQYPKKIQVSEHTRRYFGEKCEGEMDICYSPAVM